MRWLLISLSAFAQENYISGAKLCETIQKKEMGKRIEVLQNYGVINGPKTSIYHWFLGGKFDPDKPTVIHVDGGPGGTSHSYNAWKDELAKDHNILFFDQRGYVCSRPNDKKTHEDPKFYSIENSARDIEEIRKSLGLEKVSIYGESFGSTISLQYAALFPERVTAIVLEGPAFIVSDDLKKIDTENRDKIIKISKELLAKNVANCLDDQAYGDLINEVSSALGLDGLHKITNAINNKWKLKKTIPTIGELDELLGKEMSVQRRGKFALRDNKFSQETENTEIIADNELFPSDPKRKKIDSRKLKIDVPIYFFLGEYDGTTVEEINLARKTLPVSTLIEMKNLGHGPFYEIANKNSKADVAKNLRIFNQALKGRIINTSDVADYNRVSGTQILKH